MAADDDVRFERHAIVTNATSRSKGGASCRQGHFTLRLQTGFNSPDGETRTRAGQLTASTEPTHCRDGTDESAPAHPERMLSQRDMALPRQTQDTIGLAGPACGASSPHLRDAHEPHRGGARSAPSRTERCAARACRSPSRTRTPPRAFGDTRAPPHGAGTKNARRSSTGGSTHGTEPHPGRRHARSAPRTGPVAVAGASPA